LLTVVKPVYYCDHCKRHRITASAIENHEPKCIYNPQRDKCGWCSKTPTYRAPAPADRVPGFVDDPDVERLRRELDGCPACMLAVIVQSRRAGLSDEEAWEFDYSAEVARFQKEENHDYAY
jgi:hypothetical protein